MTKNQEKNIFGSELSEAKMSQLLEYTTKIDKKSREKIEKLFLAQYCLKQIMSQLSYF